MSLNILIKEQGYTSGHWISLLYIYPRAIRPHPHRSPDTLLLIIHIGNPHLDLDVALNLVSFKLTPRLPLLKHQALLSQICLQSVLSNADCIRELIGYREGFGVQRQVREVEPRGDHDQVGEGVEVGGQGCCEGEGREAGSGAGVVVEVERLWADLKVCSEVLLKGQRGIDGENIG